MTEEGLAEVAKVANGIGSLLPQVLDVNSLKSTELAEKAHQAGLFLHSYTFRQDALPAANIDSNQSFDALFDDAKVDGLFSDFPILCANIYRNRI